jgi:hypothetical protein
VVGTGDANITVFKDTGNGFMQTQQLYSGTDPHGFAVADFNEDGFNDLVNTHGGGSQYLTFFLGGPNGFSERIVLDGLGFEPGKGIAVGDFNNDGYVDVITGAFDSGGIGNQVAIYCGDGAAHFARTVTYTVGSGANEIAVADFNEDGNLDAVVTNWNEANITVLFGDGSGGISSSSVLPTYTGRPQGVCTFDINHDGHADIACAHGYGTLSAFLGNGDGTFGARIDRPANSGIVVVADMNNDEYGDLVAAEPQALCVYLWDQSQGSFAANPVSFSTDFTNSSQDMKIVDFNTDGNNDVVTTCENKVAIYFGNGQGGFVGQPTKIINLNSSPMSVAVGNFTVKNLPVTFTPPVLKLKGNGNAKILVSGDAVIPGEQIDAASVKIVSFTFDNGDTVIATDLSGSNPVVIDDDSDGILDLQLHFSRDEIKTAIGGKTGDDVVVKVIGRTINGLVFEGEAVITKIK